jgi:hypothetical protein
VPKKLLRIVAVLYFVLTAYGLLVGLAQVSLSLILMHEEDTLFTFIMGLCNMCVAHVYVAIGVGLIYQTSRAKDWALGSAVLSIPAVLISSGLNILGVLVGFFYLVVAGLLVTERLMTRSRNAEGGDVLPSGERSRWHF